MTGAGVAIAAIPDSGSGLVHGCYSTKTGVLRVVDPAKKQHCKSGERSLNWNQRGVNWRGSWSSTPTYARNDAVKYGGSSYIALKASHNVRPTTTSTWAMLASAGSVGATGRRDRQAPRDRKVHKDHRVWPAAPVAPVRMARRDQPWRLS